MSQQRNPRYWASLWYTTKFAEQPWPPGWYWHDERYDWSGPYETEEDAARALQSYENGRRIPVLSSSLHD